MPSRSAKGVCLSFVLISTPSAPMIFPSQKTLVAVWYKADVRSDGGGERGSVIRPHTTNDITQPLMDNRRNRLDTYAIPGVGCAPSDCPKSRTACAFGVLVLAFGTLSAVREGERYATQCCGAIRRAARCPRFCHARGCPGGQRGGALGRACRAQALCLGEVPREPCWQAGGRLSARVGHG